MRNKDLPKFRERNHLALHPLMHKGGVHESETLQAVRRRERRVVSQYLRDQDWLHLDADDAHLPDDL